MNLNIVLLEEFKDEMDTTRKFLASISEDLFEFIGVYLRLNNVNVPASYMASADAQLF